MKIGSMAIEVMIWIYAAGLAIAALVGSALLIYAARTVRKLSESASPAVPGAEPAASEDVQKGRCRAVTASGDRCPNQIEPRSDYCGLHREFLEGGS